jgi:hypothetical protein
METGQLNMNDASVTQLRTARFEHGAAPLIAAGREIAPGDPDAPGVIERRGGNFDLQTGSRGNFRSL